MCLLLRATAQYLDRIPVVGIDFRHVGIAQVAKVANGGARFSTRGTPRRTAEGDAQQGHCCPRGRAAPQAGACDRRESSWSLTIPTSPLTSTTWGGSTTPRASTLEPPANSTTPARIAAARLSRSVRPTFALVVISYLLPALSFSGASRVKRESWTPSISCSDPDPVVLLPGGPARRALSLRPGIGNSKKFGVPRRA